MAGHPRSASRSRRAPTYRRLAVPRHLHVMISSDLDARTGVCRCCGPVDIRVRKIRGVPTATCAVAVREHSAAYRRDLGQAERRIGRAPKMAGQLGGRTSASVCPPERALNPRPDLDELIAHGIVAFATDCSYAVSISNMATYIRTRRDRAVRR